MTTNTSIENINSNASEIVAFVTRTLKERGEGFKFVCHPDECVGDKFSIIIVREVIDNKVILCHPKKECITKMLNKAEELSGEFRQIYFHDGPNTSSIRPLGKDNLLECNKEDLVKLVNEELDTEPMIKRPIVEPEYTCEICKESIKNGEVIDLKCLHMFHEKCISDVTSKSYPKKCPICEKTFVTYSRQDERNGKNAKQPVVNALDNNYLVSEAFLKDLFDNKEERCENCDAIIDPKNLCFTLERNPGPHMSFCDLKDECIRFMISKAKDPKQITIFCNCKYNITYSSIESNKLPNNDICVNDAIEILSLLKKRKVEKN